MASHSNSSEPGQIVDRMSRLFRPEALEIDSPALVQHIAYRIHDNYANEPDKWPGSIQKLLEKLSQQLDRHAYITDYNERPAAINTGEGRRFRTARLGFKWHSIPVRMSFEINSEHLTVTAVMNLSTWKDGKTTDEVAAKKLYGNVIDLDQRLLAKNNQIKGKKESTEQNGGDDALQVEFGNLHNAIFTDIWDEFHGEILKDPLRDSGVELGECFTAGRGIVATLAGDGATKGKEPTQFILLPGQDVKPDLTKPGRPFGENEDVVAANTVLSYMQSPEDMQRVLHSVSNFVGNSLYVTAHGAESVDDPNEPKKSAAATFFLLATHPDPVRLGFLVERICMLATIRRAGLFDLLQIAKANNVLAKLSWNKPRRRGC